MTAPDLDSDKATCAAVVRDLNSTLFVEASAGSGKTSCLVDRFVALVESGIPADRIAAITFTEKAAAELVDRIRTRLQREAHDNESCREGLRMLDDPDMETPLRLLFASGAIHTCVTSRSRSMRTGIWCPKAPDGNTRR